MIAAAADGTQSVLYQAPRNEGRVMRRRASEAAFTASDIVVLVTVSSPHLSVLFYFIKLTESQCVLFSLVTVALCHVKVIKLIFLIEHHLKFLRTTAYIL